MPGVGVKIQNDLGIRECVVLAQYAEARGLSSVWVSEYRCRDALTNLAVFAAATERVELGSSIIPLYTRSPTVLGMSAAALEEIAPGRILLGLGTSSEVIVERWHGGKRERPLRAMAEYVEAIRTVMSGARVELEGEVVTAQGFSLELDFLAAPEGRIFIAALGEKMLKIGGRIGDGILLNHAPVGHVPRIREVVEGAASEAGRAAGACRIASDLRVGIGSAAEVAEMREVQRKQLAFYGNVPPYNRFYAEAGYGAQAAALRDAWGEKDRERAVAAVDDPMLDSIVAIGDGDTVRDRVRALWDAGVDEVILFPLWPEGGSPADRTRELIDTAAELMRDTGEVKATTGGKR